MPGAPTAVTQSWAFMGPTCSSSAGEEEGSIKIPYSSCCHVCAPLTSTPKPCPHPASSPVKVRAGEVALGDRFGGGVCWGPKQTTSARVARLPGDHLWSPPTPATAS